MVTPGFYGEDIRLSDQAKVLNDNDDNNTINNKNKKRNHNPNYYVEKRPYFIKRSWITTIVQPHGQIRTLRMVWTKAMKNQSPDNWAWACLFHVPQKDHLQLFRVVTSETSLTGGNPFFCMPPHILKKTLGIQIFENIRNRLRVWVIRLVWWIKW